MGKVELYHAWAWDCDECGAQNFARSIARDFGDDGEKERWYRESENMDDCTPLPEDFEEMECFMYPDVVQCEECNTQYETCVNPNLEEDS